MDTYYGGVNLVDPQNPGWRGLSQSVITRGRVPVMTKRIRDITKYDIEMASHIHDDFLVMIMKLAH